MATVSNVLGAVNVIDDVVIKPASMTPQMVTGTYQFSNENHLPFFFK